MVLFSEDSV